MEDDEDHTFEHPGKKGKKKNIFDDDVTCEAARTIIKTSQLGNEEEEEEEITFDGKPVVRYNNKTMAPAPDISSLAVPALNPATRTMSNPSSVVTVNPPAQPAQSTSYGSARNAISFGHSRSRSITFGTASGIETKGLTPKPHFVNSPMSSTTSLSEIDDFNSGSMTSLSSITRKQMSASDIDKMQQEIQRLRRSLLGAKRDRWVKLPIDDTLKRICKGESYSLELYKSLEDKLELLDKAVKIHDGNAIMTSVLFLKDTVTSTIFKQELKKRPEAADHYLNYLREHFDYAEYVTILMMLGRTEEAAVFKYRMALPTTDGGAKIVKLKDCLRNHFSSNPQLALDASLVQEFVDLLERQRPVDESDANLEAAGKAQIFRDIPRKVSLIGMPVITTLYYCCLYHYDLTENSLASPQAIKKRHQISEKQFLWTALSARAKLKSWKDIEALMTTKGWFGGTKMKSLIGFDKVVSILHRNSAPPEILEKYLMLIEDSQIRLELAKTVDCSKAIMDTYVATKNKAALENYAAQFDRYSKEGLYAHDILSSSTIRWK